MIASGGFGVESGLAAHVTTINEIGRFFFAFAMF